MKKSHNKKGYKGNSRVFANVQALQYPETSFYYTRSRMAYSGKEYCQDCGASYRIICTVPVLGLGTGGLAV